MTEGTGVTMGGDNVSPFKGVNADVNDKPLIPAGGAIASCIPVTALPEGSTFVATRMSAEFCADTLAVAVNRTAVLTRRYLLVKFMA
jgi:hypothetical protein